MSSQMLQEEGRREIGALGGINPVLLSISKSCAASVVVSTAPSNFPRTESGRGRFNKCLAGRAGELMEEEVVVVVFIVLEMLKRC